jgi:hypothetical protein
MLPPRLITRTRDYADKAIGAHVPCTVCGGPVNLHDARWALVDEAEERVVDPSDTVNARHAVRRPIHSECLAENPEIARYIAVEQNTIVFDLKPFLR